MTTNKDEKANNEISSLDQLFNILADQNLDQGTTPKYYFRGETTHYWPLIPKLLRTSTLNGEDGMPGVVKDEASIGEIQMRILQRLKRYAVHLYLQNNRPWQGAHPSDWEWLCVAQHHGLPTLLSDWTINPLVALYFSAWRSNGKDGAFYVMELNKKQFRDEHKLSIRIGQTVKANAPNSSEVYPEDRETPFSLEDADRPLIVVPLVFTRRIEAQSSRFIYAGHAAKFHPKNGKTQTHNATSEKSPPAEIFHEDALDKLSETTRPWKEIRKFRVKENAKVKILRQLRNAQIHHGTLFPDLDGYSAYLASGGD